MISEGTWNKPLEDLLRDTVEAKLLVLRGGGIPSRPSVARWIGFFDSPSAQSWYSAHNASVVAGYLAHRGLAWREDASNLDDRFARTIGFHRAGVGIAALVSATCRYGIGLTARPSTRTS